MIEDNPADVRLMKEAIRESGLNIRLESVFEGEQALRYLTRQGEYQTAERPSVIFLDLNLPRGTSKDILKFIKSDPVLKAIPVAVLTSSDSENDIREAYELYANCYLKKPVDLDSFLATFRAALNFWVTVACIPTAGY